MFWDNVLFASAMGNPLFENGIFSWSSIPIEVDPGHPPFLATLMALGWSLWGKSIEVSHWMMLPFVYGLLWQLFRLVQHFITDKALQVCAFVLVILDPTLLSQLVLVNPEIIQLFFLFLAINSMLRQEHYVKMIALAVLGIVSFRGMMFCAGVFLIDILVHRLVKKESLRYFFTIKNIMAYVVGSIPAISYLCWRLFAKGYIFTHPSKKWGNALGYESIYDLISNIARNTLVLGHIVSDFGRIAVVLFVIVTLISRRRTIDWNRVRPLIIIGIGSIIVVSIVSILIQNTMGHRYYIPLYLMTAMIAFLLLDHYRWKKTIYGLMILSLLMGNRIIYPDRFAQGWDSSLAHIPYWNLRKEALKYMDENNIPINMTATFFPNRVKIDYVDLNDDQRSFLHFSGQEPYVLYSNVYNISDDDFDRIHNQYTLIKSLKKHGVRLELYQKN